MVWYFGKYVILGWYYDILGWKLCKQTSYWSKTGFYFSVKNHDKFSSQNIVLKGHEQVFSTHPIPLSNPSSAM